MNKAQIKLQHMNPIHVTDPVKLEDVVRFHKLQEEVGDVGITLGDVYNMGTAKLKDLITDMETIKECLSDKI